MAEILNDRFGIKTTFHWNEDGTFHVNTTQDVQPILEANKEKALANGKKTKGKDIFPVASIPVTVQYEWVKRYGIKSVFDEEAWPVVKKLLNSNEWRYLRTSEVFI